MSAGRSETKAVEGAGSDFTRNSSRFLLSVYGRPGDNLYVYTSPQFRSRTAARAFGGRYEQRNRLA
jgi:hypothetical protein